MAVDKKISQLASGAPAQAGDEYVVARSGANYKLTLTNIAASMPATTITTGNLTFSSTAQRITGDFSNATQSNRVYVQTSTSGGNTSFGLLPHPSNATPITTFEACLSSDAVNTNVTQVQVTTTDSRFNAGARGTATSNYLPMTFYTGGSERVRIDTSGNVGIGGTATATDKVGIEGALPSSGSASNGFAVRGTIPSGSTAGANAFISKLTTAAASFTTGEFRHYYASPSTKGAGSTITNQYGFLAESNLTEATNNYGFFSNIASGSNRWNFYAAGTAQNYFAGNVGIGTTTPAGKFNVASGRSFFGANSETYSIAVAYTQARCNSGQTYYIGATDSATPDLVFSNAAGTERMRIADNGEVIVGITDQGAYNLQCNGTGVWGAGAYVNGSDARLKDNITTLNDGLNVVSQLRPVTFKYKPDYSKDQNVQTGFIAQELQAVLAGKDYVDGIVQAGPNHLNVAYQSLIPILVKAIQELTARVAELEAK
jgi:hypothetical protein